MENVLRLQTTRIHRWLSGVGLVLVTWVSLPAGAFAGAPLAPEPAVVGAPEEVEPAVVVATVRLDGRSLFPVHGFQSRPAAERARAIADRIASAAADTTVSVDSLATSEIDIGTQVMAGDKLLLVVTDADAQLYRLSRAQAVSYIRIRLRQAMVEYRADRSPPHLWKAFGIAAVATLGVVLLLIVVARLTRRFRRVIHERTRGQARGVKIQSLELVAPETLSEFLDGVLRLVRTIIVVVLLFFYTDFVLSLFPWTRAAAAGLFGYVLDPLRVMGISAVHYLPNLMFLIVLVAVTKLVLGFLKLAASGVDQGRITLPGFHPEWAWPTFQLVRIVAIAFAVVISFPYIPGSNSPAFQGVSLFVGVLLSVGSPSLMGNLVAGYTMIYWRALRVGDRVQIGDVIGVVTETRPLVTRIRTAKNEEIVIPNSRIMSEKIVNYTALAKPSGLILHTTVGIGYETPWRQVEAMLLMAAQRTPGLLAEPRPFVLQRALGDFAVTYELNVYTDAPDRMLKSYDVLHRNILDVFNEYGVQIMTPAYVADPAEAKIVTKQNWNAAPAGPAGE